MSVKSTLFQNSFWNLTGYVYLLIASLISLPFIITSLGQQAYAVYLVVLAVSAILSTIDFGVPTSLLRSLSGGTLAKDQILSLRSGLLLTFCIAVGVSWLSRYLLVSTGQLPIWGFAPELQLQLLNPLSALIFGTLLLSYFAAVPQGRSDFAMYNVRSFIVGTGNTLGAAVVAMTTHDPALVLWTQVACTILTLTLFMLYAISHFGLRILVPTFSHTAIRTHLTFGFPVFLGNLAPQLQANLVRFVTGAFLPPLGITAVAVAQSLVVRGTGLFNQFTSAFFPTAANLSSLVNRQRLRRLTSQLTLAFILMAFVALGLIYLFGEPLLLWWLQDESLATSVYPVLLAYLVYACVLAVTPAVSTVLTATGYPVAPMITAWLHTFLEFGLMLYLVPRLGAIGAPYSGLVAVSLSSVLLLIFYYRYLPSRTRVKIG